MQGFDWVDAQEKQNKEKSAEGYFNVVEGTQKFVLLTHCAPLAQVFEEGKYRAAVEGDKNVSIKGVCWVWQDGMVKQAKLPYTVVKAIRGLQQNPEWDFAIPFLHPLTLTAKNAGTKEVEYNLTPSPKTVEIPANILVELQKKPTPEEVVEIIKGNKVSPRNSTEEAQVNYPTGDIDPDNIPF